MNTSEFTCEVVRVTEVLPHPNADRLEIIKFETKEGGPSAYSVIHGKDQLKPNDLVVYVSVDAMVPLEGYGSACWQFLKTRLDYRKGSPTYRIKAANLRKVYSEGILLMASDHDSDTSGLMGVWTMDIDDTHRVSARFGDSVADQLGIVKYERPDPAGERSGFGTPPTRVPVISPKQFPVYEILSYRKCPFAIKDGDPVIFTEKIHGCNFRCGWLNVGMWKWPTFVIGSHRTIKSDLRSFPRRVWDWITGKSKTYKHWYGEDVWTYTAETNQFKKKLQSHPGLVIYGEVFGVTPSGKRIQDLTYGQTLQFRLIDAYDAVHGTWLTWRDLQALAVHLGVETVPVLSYQIWSEETREFMVTSAERQSSIDPDTIMEGYVIRSAASDLRVKYVSKQYAMRSDADA